MKFLIIDYDRIYITNKEKKIIEINKEIKKFIKKGNIFALATEKNYIEIKEEITKYNITYDYLICNNGRVIFDAKDKIIYKYPIPENLLFEALEILYTSEKIKKIELINTKGNITIITSEVIEILCQVNIKDINELKKINKLINNLECITSFNTSKFKTTSDKKDAIEIIAKLKKISKNNIYTIGNNSSDIKMLKSYNGYKTSYYNPYLSLKNIKTTPSIKSLIKRINN